MNRHQMMQHELDVWLPAPEFAKGVHNQAMPGYGIDRRSMAIARGWCEAMSVRAR